jgi:hypothetical protein
MCLPRVGGLGLQVPDLAGEFHGRGHQAPVLCNTPEPALNEDGCGRRFCMREAGTTVRPDRVRLTWQRVAEQLGATPVRDVVFLLCIGSLTEKRKTMQLDSTSLTLLATASSY